MAHREAKPEQFYRRNSLPISHRVHEASSNTVRDYARAHFGDVNVYGQPHTTVNTVDTEKFNVLLASLTFERMDSRLRNIATPQPKTCEWLFSHDQFKSWVDTSQARDHHNFLWIKGKPGCGKSTIMKRIVVWAHKEWSNKLILSYFFNARAPQQLEKSCLGMYRLLVYQTVSSSPQLRTTFLAHFNLKEYKGKVSEWTETELQEFLVDVVVRKLVGSFSMFIDALDEGEQDDIRQMISFLEDLAEHSASNGVLAQICLSSRHYPHIHIRKGLSFHVEEQIEHAKDIQHYVHTKLTDVESREMQEIRDYVCVKSLGVFLWVELVVRMLNQTYDRGYGLTAMMDLLKTIPEGLENLFSNILAKDSQNLEDCAHLLQWVLFSKQPMTPEELYFATFYSRPSSHKEDVKVPDARRLAKYILDCSRGLVEMSSSNPQVVQFIHETVRDFLLRKGGLIQIQPSIASNVRGLSYNNLKFSCLRYIRRYGGDPVTKTKRRHESDLVEDLTADCEKRFPWLKYAARNLLIFAEEAETCHVSQQDLIESMSTDESEICSKFFESWNLFYGLRADFSVLATSWDPLPADPSALLYVLAEHNLLKLAKSLLQRPVDINATAGIHGSVLKIASLLGNDEIVGRLLEKGAHLNDLGGKYGTALQAASVEGHDQIVKMLLEHGANTNLVGGVYGTALQAATARNHQRTVQMLIEHGADVNAQGGIYGTALHAAAAKGREELVAVLLTNGADINAFVLNGRYTTPLRAALDQKRNNVVDILLKKGAIDGI